MPKNSAIKIPFQTNRLHSALTALPYWQRWKLLCGNRIAALRIFEGIITETAPPIKSGDVRFWYLTDIPSTDLDVRY
jgi:hypothetical protein